MGFTATPRKARALVPLFCAWINSFLATGEVAVVVEEVAARAGRPRVKYWLLGPFKVWTGLRERRRAADTLRRRRRGGGATPTVGTLSRTARTGPTRSWKMSAAKTCMGWEPAFYGRFREMMARLSNGLSMAYSLAGLLRLLLVILIAGTQLRPCTAVKPLQPAVLNAEPSG